RRALMTPILLAPAIFKTTVKDDCSSAGAASVGVETAAAMTGAAADTPNFSSKALTSSLSSRTESSSTWVISLVTLSDMFETHLL
ncbi:MAG: 50S ribosomal protein L7/L12, partial [Microgenomates group bacterium Gr01-1014_16]